MLFQSVFYKNSKFILAALLVSVSLHVFADKDVQIDSFISAIGTGEVISENSVKSTPNSFVDLDFSIHNGESWDSKDKQNNIISHCMDGTAITGFEAINVTIQTFVGSYFSEAAIYFSDSNLGDDGILYVIGSGNNTSGTATFNSNGILDITDASNEDVLSMDDDKFFIQFYEIIDDSQGTIDALFTNGILRVWGVDLVASSDCPFVEAVAIEPAELSVEYSLNQNTSSTNRIGSTLTFDITIINNGESAATNVSIENELSPVLRFIEMSCDDGTNIEDVTETTNLQDIAANSSLHCSLDAVIISYGQISNSITVSSDSDSDISNNSTTLIISGAALAIPINNYLALLLLAMCLLYFARKKAF